MYKTISTPSMVFYANIKYLPQKNIFFQHSTIPTHVNIAISCFCKHLIIIETKTLFG